MTKHDVGSDWESSSRGAAAWKEEMDRLASRNAEARKQGKQRRETYERDREDARRAAEAKRRVRFLKEHDA